MLCVFESAIDLLSYATMAQAGGLSWRSQHLLSLAGVYKPQKETQEHRLPLALTQYLKDHAEIKTICLCLDNDMTGRSATEAIRQQLAERYALRTKAVRDSPKQADAHRAQIRELSERLKALRREVHLCDDIAERSGVMAEKLKAVREDAQKQRQKEEQQHEHIRRRS